MSPINPISRMMAKVVVRPRLVFSRPPDSRRLSSNIRVSPCYRAYVNLDTDQLPFAPELNDDRGLGLRPHIGDKPKQLQQPKHNKRGQVRVSYRVRAGMAMGRFPFSIRQS